MKFYMYITIESDLRETKLSKAANLHFIPHNGMGFWYGTVLADVKCVDYTESDDKFILQFENIKENDNRFDRIVRDLTDNGWKIKDQWKKK